MFVLALVLTILLLLEALPSAGAGLLRSQAGMRRLDGLARLGLPERNLWIVPVLGAVHLAGSAAVIAGLELFAGLAVAVLVVNAIRLA